MADVLRAFYAHIAAHVILHTALLIPPSVLSHAILAGAVLPLIWSCHIYAWKYGLGYISVIHALWSAELLLFRDPRKDFGLLHVGTPPRSKSPVATAVDIDSKNDRIEKDASTRPTVEKNDDKIHKKAVITEGSKKARWIEAYPQSWWKRFVWVSKLVLSPRYIGWATSKSQTILYGSQPPPPSSKSRKTFIIQKISLIGCSIAVLDAVHYYQHFDPYFQIQTSIDEAFPRRLGGFFARHHLGFLSSRFVRVTVFGLEKYSTLNLLDVIPAVIFVTLGWIGLADDFWGRVDNWPSIMGNPIAVAQRGLRGFWGCFWHQMFRNFLTGPGQALSRAIGLHPRSAISYAIQVIVAFGLSGNLNSAYLPRDTKNFHPIRVASFFLIQSAIVLSEMILVRAVTKLGFEKPRSTWALACLAFMNIAWTGIVLYQTVPMLQDELTRVSRMYGLRTVYFIPFPKYIFKSEDGYVSLKMGTLWLADVVPQPMNR